MIPSLHLNSRGLGVGVGNKQPKLKISEFMIHSLVEWAQLVTTELKMKAAFSTRKELSKAGVTYTVVTFLHPSGFCLWA